MFGNYKIHIHYEGGCYYPKKTNTALKHIDSSIRVIPMFFTKSYFSKDTRND